MVWLARVCSTQSEVVVPVVAAAAPAVPPPAAAVAAASKPPHQQQQQQQAPSPGCLLAVLDVDSNHPAAFDEVDAWHLEQL